jgi:hypothetical protein
MWQYATIEGSSINSNLIEYKAIDSSTDMILTSNFDNQINFNRILSSTTSPYPIDSSNSKTFSVSAQILSGSDEVCGLFIKDLNLA